MFVEGVSGASPAVRGAHGLVKGSGSAIFLPRMAAMTNRPSMLARTLSLGGFAASSTRIAWSSSSEKRSPSGFEAPLAQASSGVSTPLEPAGAIRSRALDKLETNLRNAVQRGAG